MKTLKSTTHPPAALGPVGVGRRARPRLPLGLACKSVAAREMSADRRAAWTAWAEGDDHHGLCSQMLRGMQMQRAIHSMQRAIHSLKPQMRAATDGGARWREWRKRLAMKSWKPRGPRSRRTLCSTVGEALLRSLLQLLMAKSAHQIMWGQRAVRTPHCVEPRGSVREWICMQPSPRGRDGRRPRDRLRRLRGRVDEEGREAWRGRLRARLRDQRGLDMLPRK